MRRILDDKLKVLSGSWEGQNSQGKPLSVTYGLMAGSALLSEIRGHDGMICMFHLDGDRLLMTHYCGAGNQPRMQTKASPDGTTFAFDFVDRINLDTSKIGHVYRAVLAMVTAAPPRIGLDSRAIVCQQGVTPDKGKAV